MKKIIILIIYQLNSVSEVS